MGRKRKQKLPQLSAEQAAFGGEPELTDSAAMDPAEVMLAFIAAEDGDLLKRKGVGREYSDSLPAAKRSATPRKGRYALEIDLHGLTLVDALLQVDMQIRYCFSQGHLSIDALIITGKGLHSGKEGSILAREVHRHVSSKYRDTILQIEGSPASALVNGIPVRGHFRVVLKSEK